MNEHDLIVVGGGLAGSEAAWAAARAGLRTLLVSTSLDTIYNLAEGGAALTPEPGSLMAAAVAEAEDGYLSARELHRAVKERLESEQRLHLLQSSVSGLLVEDGKVRGVSTWEGIDRLAPRVALCVGSFLEGRLTIGSSTEEAGRLSEMAYDDLYLDLLAHGFGFEGMRLEAPPTEGSLPYVVECKRFERSEWNEASMTLPRLGGLYAAGLCASGYLEYEEAAAEGTRLAGLLASRAG